MFKIGDKLKCINEAYGVYIEKDEIVEFVEKLKGKTERFDIKVKCDKSLYQNASSKNFVKVED